ncbi:MAG: hypothetical protein WC779_04670 [Candidatus Omnitrophota bacterium]|jgi:hypothetical protein
MKRIVTVVMLSCSMFAAAAGDVFAFRDSRESSYTPRVEYMNPANGAVVEMAGRSSIVFSWKMVPIPSGGRDSYRFTLYKAEGYEVVENAVLNSETFSFEVPAAKFEPGQRYRWQVKQRDSDSMQWSEYDSWYFKIAENAQ